VQERKNTQPQKRTFLSLALRGLQALFDPGAKSLSFDLTFDLAPNGSNKINDSGPEHKFTIGIPTALEQGRYDVEAMHLSTEYKMSPCETSHLVFLLGEVFALRKWATTAAPRVLNFSVPLVGFLQKAPLSPALANDSDFADTISGIERELQDRPVQTDEAAVSLYVDGCTRAVLVATKQLLALERQSKQLTSQLDDLAKVLPVESVVAASSDPGPDAGQHQEEAERENTAEFFRGEEDLFLRETEHIPAEPQPVETAHPPEPILLEPVVHRDFHPIKPSEHPDEDGECASCGRRKCMNNACGGRHVPCGPRGQCNLQ